jgi:tRNA modification GTPase
MVEVSVDFADEDLAPLAPADLAGGIAAAAGALREALDRCGRWSPASAEPRVAIAGRPNAGKSSLLNVLSGVDRAIVSAMAGTTRDVLTAPAALPGGLEVILLDAAGLHAGDDPLDRAAHRAARDAVTAAEAVLYVLDAAEARRRGPAAEAELLAEVRRLNRRTEPLVLANKADLLPDPSRPSARLAEALGAEPLAISTATGAGLEELRAELADRLAGSAAPRSAGLLLHDRQRRAIAAAAESAERAAHLLASAPAVADVAELVAADLADASAHLAELTGEVLSEDLLDTIFARFCIGK